MTDAELLALEKVGPEHAAQYLQNGTNAQEIRIFARMGKCPFCTAYQPTGRRWVYRVNVGLLMKHKAGELGLQ
jgi:hypothetical protein